MRRGQLLSAGIALAVSACLTTVSGCSEGSDPTIEGLIGDPDAALEFLYPDGVVEPGTSPVAIKYIRDTDWNDDGFDTLTQMLDQAATAYRDPNNPKSELSALAATDTINLLGERDNLPNTGNDSLGHLLSNYIIDIDSHVDNARSGSVPPLQELGTVFVDLPPSAQFEREQLGNVLEQTMEDADQIRAITNAALQFNNSRIMGALELGTDAWGLTAVVSVNVGLLNFVAHNAGLDEQDDEDARSDAMIGELNNTLNLIPTNDASFGTYLAGNAITNPENPTLRIESITPRRLPVKSGLYEGILRSSDYGTGVQLGRAGLLNPNDPDEERWPWFPNDVFDLSLALAPENRRSFSQSLRLDPEWKSTFRAIDKEIFDELVNP